MVAMFRPMLAYDGGDEHYREALGRGSLLVSNKLDGIRAIVRNGILVSRSLKLIRNTHTQRVFSNPLLEGVDGELIVGLPFGEGVFARTSSGVMSEGGTPNVKFHVFDYIHPPEEPYIRRLSRLHEAISKAENDELSEHLVIVKQHHVTSLEVLNRLEADAVERGYEGLIVRSPNAPYKFGRSTLKEGYMGKLKRFHDSEAIVIGFEELMHNDNLPTQDALGYTHRSSHKANQRPSGMLGNLQVRDLKTAEWVFGIGSGFDHNTRRQIWENRSSFLGRTVKYKYLQVGTIDAPRHPIFLGFRHKEDL